MSCWPCKANKLHDDAASPVIPDESEEENINWSKIKEKRVATHDRRRSFLRPPPQPTSKASNKETMNTTQAADKWKRGKNVPVVLFHEQRGLTPTPKVVLHPSAGQKSGGSSSGSALSGPHGLSVYTGHPGGSQSYVPSSKSSSWFAAIEVPYSDIPKSTDRESEFAKAFRAAQEEEAARAMAMKLSEAHTKGTSTPTKPSYYPPPQFR